MKQKTPFARRIAIGLAATATASHAAAADLGIQPVAQQTPEWCWAAASQMVLQHLGVRSINPVGNYQCGVVAAQGGVCWWSCASCLGGGGTTVHIAAVDQLYVQLAGANVMVQPAGPLSPYDIAQSINANDPIIAGISPVGMGYPPGSGFSEHAVVIEGYNGVPGAPNFDLIVNDPLPSNVQLWSMAGAMQRQPGQYEISYPAFVYAMHYGNSILFR